MRHLRCRIQVAALRAHVRLPALSKTGSSALAGTSSSRTGCRDWPGTSRSRAASTPRRRSCSACRPATTCRRWWTRCSRRASPTPWSARAWCRTSSRARACPTRRVGPTTIYAQRLSVVDSRTASVAWLGTRSSAALSGFYVKTRDAVESDLLLGTGSPVSNNVQYGGAFTVAHKIAAQTSLSASIDWRRIRSLDAVVANESTQTGALAAAQRPALSQDHRHRGHPLPPGWTSSWARTATSTRSSWASTTGSRRFTRQLEEGCA